jgi:SdrD B-like domain
MKHFFIYFIVLTNVIRVFAQGDPAAVTFTTIMAAEQTNSSGSTTIAVENGNTYIAMYTRGKVFNDGGPSNPYNTALAVTKYDANNNIVYRTFIPFVIGATLEQSSMSLRVLNGEVFVVSTINVTIGAAARFYATDGSVSQAGIYDNALIKLNAAGGIAFSKYLGTAGQDGAADLFVDNNYIYYATKVPTNAGNLPLVGGTAYNGNTAVAQSEIYLATFNQSGVCVASRYLGGSLNDDFAYATVENGNFYIAASSTSPDIPITSGTPNTTGVSQLYVAKVNGLTMQVDYGVLMGSDGSDTPMGLSVLNGKVAVAAIFEGNYTNYSNVSGPFGNCSAVLLLNTTGAITSATMLGNAESYPQFTTASNRIMQEGAFTYYMTEYKQDVANPFVVINAPPYSHSNAYVAGLTKMASNGSIVYNTIVLSKPGSTLGIKDAYTVKDGYVYIMAQKGSNQNSHTFAPTTEVSPPYDPVKGILWIGKIDPSGNLVYGAEKGQINIGSIFFGAGTMAARSPMLTMYNNTLHLTSTISAPFAVTNNTFATATNPFGLFNYIGRNVMYMKLDMCPALPTSSATVAPATQTVCQYGLATKLVAPATIIDGGAFPPLNIAGQPVAQASFDGVYQWQSANTATGPWTDIAYGVLKDYLPSVAATDQYYRRISRASPLCGGAVYATSSVAAVLVNSNTAPTADAGGVFYTCAGVPKQIGTPSATGGTPPYTYLYDNALTLNDNTLPNPTATTNQTTLYTLEVTDALGCKQIDQAVLEVFAPNAPNIASCAGAPVRIGSVPPASLVQNGATFAWSPATNLSCTNCAQPMANPTVATTYTVTITLPGSICSVTDEVVVTPVAAPITPNFAGADQVICKGTTATIGTAAEPGFTYTWAPGNYLTANNTATTTFNSGSYLPYGNPMTYYLTAVNGACAFYDAMEVAVIVSRAGFDGCGPRIVGEPDITPNIADTYTWTKLSGNGTFTGATNIPQTTVSASTGGVPSIYQLVVTYNGTSCTSQVVVPDCGCQIILSTNAPAVCPTTAFGAVDIIASAFSVNSSNADYFTYSWSPAAGLSTTTGRTVTLTDNIQRTYTVTMTDPANGAFNCTAAIAVNDPAWSLPVFNAQDHLVCLGSTVSIGQPNIAGYAYAWEGPNYYTNTTSNPSITIAPTSGGQYKVTVTDTGSGCVTKDIGLVEIQPTPADAGPDWTICDNATIKIGTPAVAGMTYSWLPLVGSYANGTNQNSAQPEFTVATSNVFTVTVTNTATGCTSTDAVTVTINNSPTITDIPNKTLCRGVSTTIGTQAPLPGVLYTWSPANALNCTACPNPVCSATTTTTYVVTATFPGTCASQPTDQVVITVNGLALNLGPDISVCPSAGPVNIGANAPTATSYFWSPSTGLSAANVQNPTSSATVPMVYTLIVKDAGGCETIDNIALTPLSTPNAGLDKTVCKNTPTLLGSASNTGTILWSPATGLSCTTCAQPEFLPTAGGVYTFTITQTVGGCTNTDNVTITVNNFAMPALSAAAVCQNACVNIGTPAVQGVTYFWSPTLGLASPNAATTLACVGTTDATYQLTAVNAQGCTDIQSVNIGVSPIAPPTVTLANLTFCQGGSAQQFAPTVSPVGVYNYTWSAIVENTTTTIANPISETPTINPIAAGTENYALQVINTATGCATTTNASAVVAPCVILSTGSVGNYVWADTDGSGTQNGSETGINNVTVQLWNADTNMQIGADVLTSTNAGNDGYYNFVITTSGNYKIKFPTAIGAKTLTTQTATAATNGNSDANTGTGFSPVFAIDINGTGTAKDNPTIDAGYVCPNGCVTITRVKTK